MCVASDFDVSNLTVEELFQRLEIDNQHAANFTKEGIDVEALLTCTEEDFKEAELPHEPRERLLNFIQSRRNKAEREVGGATGTSMTGLEAYQRAAVTSEVGKKLDIVLKRTVINYELFEKKI